MTTPGPAPRRHGSLPSPGPLLAPQAGRFGRLFRDLPVHEPSEASLQLLGRLMVDTAEVSEVDLGEPDPDENPEIPAGYTYLGQFLDHDITFDPTSSLQRQNDPDVLVDFRTPRFDLDSLYGRGPVDQPYLYAADGLRFLLSGRDVPRNVLGRAIIGDPRNDENVIVSQLQYTFLAFHNAVVDRLIAAGTPLAEVFEEAQRLVRWHYQWIIVNEFLPRICDEDVAPGPIKPLAYIPVEFSVAAYRFGHSMIRPGYFLSDRQRREQRRRVPLASLDGFRPVPDELLIDWSFFFPGLRQKSLDNRPIPQSSYKIDISLSEPLGSLPQDQASGGPRSLAVRDLVRGLRFGLPSGQRVAAAMGLTPLDDEALGLTLAGLRRRCRSGEDGQALADAAADFAGEAPLWYYVLREAEVQQGGRRLGQVGGRLVSCVILGLLAADASSFFQAEPTWRPTLPAARPGTFTMADLMTFTFTQTNTGVEQMDTLEDLIRKQNPYGEIIEFLGIDDDDLRTLAPDDAVGEADIRATRTGTAADLTSNESIYYAEQPGANQIRRRLDTEVASEGRDGLWWRFGSPAHPGRHIAKAIRVPYKIQVLNNEGVYVTRIEHLLIGYEGWAT